MSTPHKSEACSTIPSGSKVSVAAQRYGSPCGRQIGIRTADAINTTRPTYLSNLPANPLTTTTHNYAAAIVLLATTTTTRRFKGASATTPGLCRVRSGESGNDLDEAQRGVLLHTRGSGHFFCCSHTHTHTHHIYLYLPAGLKDSSFASITVRVIFLFCFLWLLVPPIPACFIQLVYIFEERRAAEIPPQDIYISSHLLFCLSYLMVRALGPILPTQPAYISACLLTSIPTPDHPGEKAGDRGGQNPRI